MPSYSSLVITLALLLDMEAGAFKFPSLKARDPDNENKNEHKNENSKKDWHNPEYDGCPYDERFPQGCEILMPPFPTCMNAKFIDWMVYAMNDGSPNCCGDDLSACTCPVKNSEHFQMGIAYACQEIDTCGAIAKGIMATKAVKTDLEKLRAIVEDGHLNWVDEELKERVAVELE